MLKETLENNINHSEAVIAAQETIKSLSENLLVSFDFNPPPPIEFTEDEMQTIEELDIELDKYSIKEQRDSKRRIFTKEKFVEFLGILFGLLAIIQNCIYHYEDNKQSQEVAQQIEQLNESQKRTNELLEAIIEQIEPEITDDETLD